MDNVEQLVEEMERLVATNDGFDTEILHLDLDNLLLNFIGSEKVKEIFNQTDLWYA